MLKLIIATMALAVAAVGFSQAAPVKASKKSCCCIEMKGACCKDGKCTDKCKCGKKDGCCKGGKCGKECASGGCCKSATCCKKG